jgi:hypothetical protein
MAVSIPPVYLILLGSGRDKPSWYLVPVTSIPATLLRRMDDTREEDRTGWWTLLEQEAGLERGQHSNETYKRVEDLHELVMRDEVKGKDVTVRIVDTYSFA